MQTNFRSTMKMAQTNNMKPTNMKKLMLKHTLIMRHMVDIVDMVEMVHMVDIVDMVEMVYMVDTCHIQQKQKTTNKTIKMIKS